MSFIDVTHLAVGVLAQSYDKQADQFESLLFNVALDAEPYQLS